MNEPTPSQVEMVKFNSKKMALICCGLKNVIKNNSYCFTRLSQSLSSLNHNSNQRLISTGQQDQNVQVLKDEDKQAQLEEVKHIFKDINDSIERNDYGSNFAIVHLYGKQHLIHKNDIILVKHSISADVGDKIKLEKCLLAGNQKFTVIGRPLLNRDFVHIEATVLEKTMSHTLYNLIMVPRKHRFRRYQFKRYPLATLRINHITFCHKLNETQTEIQ